VRHDGHDFLRTLLQLLAVLHEQRVAPRLVEVNARRGLELSGDELQQLVDVDLGEVLADHFDCEENDQQVKKKNSLGLFNRCFKMVSELSHERKVKTLKNVVAHRHVVLCTKKLLHSVGAHF